MFSVPYKDRFKEGEYKNRTQFMFGGEPQKISFNYYGPSVEAVLDKFPMAKVVDEKEGVCSCWVSVKQFSKNDTATACQDWLRSTRLGRGSIKSHVRTVKVLGMGLFAFQERVHLWKGVTH